MSTNSGETYQDIIFLGEEDYTKQLRQVVRPVLEENRKTGYFQSFDGVSIYYEFYKQPKEAARIVISHGFCEFTEKFEEVIFYFYQAGYSVYLLDHRGHGYSEREVEDRSKVYIKSYEVYVRDLHQFITEIVTKDKGKQKLVLFAHSMGGAIAALYLEQYPEIFDCAVLSAPMLEIDCGRIPTPIVWMVLQYKRLIRAEKAYVSGHHAFDGIPRFETSACMSEARYQHSFSKRLQDEHYQTWGATCAWTLASINAVRRLQRNAKRVKTPILLFQAGKDATVKPGGQIRFSMRSKNTELVLLPASKHEIYSATTAIRKQYYHTMFAYMMKQLCL